MTSWRDILIDALLGTAATVCFIISGLAVFTVAVLIAEAVLTP